MTKREDELTKLLAALDNRTSKVDTNICWLAEASKEIKLHLERLNGSVLMLVLKSLKRANDKVV